MPRYLQGYDSLLGHTPLPDPHSPAHADIESWLWQTLGARGNRQAVLGSFLSSSKFDAASEGGLLPNGLARQQARGGDVVDVSPSTMPWTSRPTSMMEQTELMQQHPQSRVSTAFPEGETHDDDHGSGEQEHAPAKAEETSEAKTDTPQDAPGEHAVAFSKADAEFSPADDAEKERIYPGDFVVERDLSAGRPVPKYWKVVNAMQLVENKTPPTPLKEYPKEDQIVKSGVKAGMLSKADPKAIAAKVASWPPAVRGKFK